MAVITLRADLHEELKINADLESRNLNEVVNEAVEQYLRERQRRKIEDEISAYEGLHGELQQKYQGKWVAIHNQQLVDHDKDGTKLYKRIRAKYGPISVLIRQVSEFPSKEVWHRTPTTGRIQS